MGFNNKSNRWMWELRVIILNIYVNKYYNLNRGPIILGSAIHNIVKFYDVKVTMEDENINIDIVNKTCSIDINF